MAVKKVTNKPEGNKTEEEKKIDILKKKYNVDTIYTLEVPVDDKGNFLTAYLKKPDRQILSAVAAFQQDQIKASEILLNSIWLEGDERIKTDDELFFSALTALQDIIKVRVSTLKKN